MNHYLLRRTTALLVILVILLLRINVSCAADFLDPEAAFKLKAELNNSRAIELHWEIAKGYKLYRDKVKVAVETGKAQLQSPVLPKGIKLTDPSTNVVTKFSLS